MKLGEVNKKSKKTKDGEQTKTPNKQMNKKL
jgi:hypothetical protein